jgi:hypothetical protein
MANNNMYVMEKRKSDHSLDLSDPQAPFFYCTENDIFGYYFRKNPASGPSATQEAVRQWYADQGFYWRSKTWPPFQSL